MSTDPAGTVVTVQAYESCAVTRVLRRIGDKWSPAVIRLLSERDYGFNELDRSIEGISRRMLTRTLRVLEEEGFVSRASGGPPPAPVRYSLTSRGRSLREQLHALARWADMQSAPELMSPVMNQAAAVWASRTATAPAGDAGIRPPR